MRVEGSGYIQKIHKYHALHFLGGGVGLLQKEIECAAQDEAAKVGLCRVYRVQGNQVYVSVLWAKAEALRLF